MDWKDIKPLKETETRTIVKEYFSNHGFSVLEINPKNLPQAKKSPDFVIKKGGDIKGYCEVKTPAHILNPITHLYHWDTTFYKLRKFLHKARKQFSDYDPNHKKPWIVVFTSNHPQLNWKSFADNVIGAIVFNGKILKDFRNKNFITESNKDLISIDLIIWLQVNYIDRRKVYQVRFFVNNDGSLIDEVKILLDELESESKI